jgi:hypothetical protein
MTEPEAGRAAAAAAAAAAADRGSMRASHADRDQVIEVLKAAFVLGRLAKDEFDVRVGQVLVARTYTELASVTRDIRPRTARGQRSLTSADGHGGQATKVDRRPAVQRPRPARKARVSAWVAGVMIPLAMVAALYVTGNGVFFLLAALTFIAVTPIGVICLASAWQEHQPARRQRRLLRQPGKPM